MCCSEITTSKSFARLIIQVAFSWIVKVQHIRRFLYRYTKGLITILRTMTAVAKPAINLTACHFTGFTDVQALNADLVIDVGIVFPLHNFANMKSLNTVIVHIALLGAMILWMWGSYVYSCFFFVFFFVSQLRRLGSNFIVSGTSVHQCAM